MPPPGGTRTALSQMVAWLTSKTKANPTQGTKTNADEKPFDVNQFKETFQPDDGVFSPKRTSGWDAIGVVDWERHLSHFLTELAATTFQGLALDYDGTVVDTARRWDPPEPAIAATLQRLLEQGIPIAFATGRGGSMADMLRRVLPPALWIRVLITARPRQLPVIARAHNEGAPARALYARARLRRTHLIQTGDGHNARGGMAGGSG